MRSIGDNSRRARILGFRAIAFRAGIAVGRVPVSSRQLIGRAPRPLAQTALELPTVVRASDGNDVEVEAFVPLVRVLGRNECNLAQEGTTGIAMTLGIEHLQILVMQRASRSRFALISGLDDDDVGNGAASQMKERACPTDRLPHNTSLLFAGGVRLFFHCQSLLRY